MSKMINFARLQVGKPYVFGKSGPDSFDCSGLTKRAAAQIGLDLYHGATTQWLRGSQTGPPNQYAYFGEAGPIQALPPDKVAFLFNQDKSRADKLVMAHVGIYDGKGNVVQAGGYGGRGVHYNPLDRRRWSHYALLSPYWAERDGADMVDDTALRRGSIGDAVRELQTTLITLGYDVGKNTLADGKFGPATETGVKAFQKDYGLPQTGEWGTAEAQALDAGLEDELEPPANDDTEMVLVPRPLLAELEGLNKRQAVIIAALRGVV